MRSVCVKRDPYQEQAHAQELHARNGKIEQGTSSLLDLFTGTCLQKLPSCEHHSIEARSSSALFALRYAGAMSNTVLHPLCPSPARRCAALA